MSVSSLHRESINSLIDHHIIGSTSGCATPQYRAVLKESDAIIRMIKATPSAKETVFRKCKMASWIATDTDCPIDNLVDCVLQRIREDASEFSIFVKMLRDTTGMATLADKLEKNMTECYL